MIPSLTYLDRYRNEGTRTYSRHAEYSEADARYRPDSRHSSFELPSFRVPSQEMNVYRANPPLGIMDRYLDGDHVLFFVHPQVLETQGGDPYVQRTLSIGLPAPPVSVSPTSSTRTLVVQGHRPLHALKVHFPFRVSRYGRRMRDEVVEQAVALSAELEGGISALDGSFGFLREVLGVSHRNLDPDAARAENWGFLVRDLRPFPQAGSEGKLVPGFSLYGRDFFDPDLPPVLYQLMGARDPASYVLEGIMLPIVRHWVGCFRRFGFILEPHGQNVLLEIGDDGRVERIVHRDLSLGIDMRRRRDLGLGEGSLNRYNRMEDGMFGSIAYDKFMGDHFFEAVVEAVRSHHPNIRAEEFRGPCREEFARLFPEHREYLPSTVYYFSETRDRFGKPAFQNTGEAPRWRP